MMRMVHPSKGNTDFKEGAKLLEMETSSESDQEHFVLPASKKGPRKRKAGKSSGCCSSGPAVVAVVSTVAILLCVLILAPFIYQLKKDVDSLRKSTLSGQSKSNPGEFQAIHRQQTDLQKAIREIQSGKGGLLYIRQNVTMMLKQLTTLSATTHQLSNSLDAAPQLKALPKTVNDLKKDIADVGSKLAGVQHAIEELQNSKTLLSDKVDSMKKQLSGMVRVVSGAPEKPADEGSPQMMQEIKGLSDAVTKANLSTWQQFTVVLSRGQQHEMQIAELRNVTHDFESRLRLVELAGSPRSEYNLSAVIQRAVNSVKEELLNRSESKGESAVTALRVDVTALNASLQNINTLQKTNSTAGSPLSTPADITSLSNYMNTTDGKVQQLQNGLQTVVVNITAMDIRLKSHEDRLSAVEKSTHDVATEATHTTENNTHVTQSEGVLKITLTNDQSASDQHTGLTSSTDNITMSDKKSSVQLDKNKAPLVATGQTANVQDIFVQEGIAGARSGSGTRGGSSITTQQKSTPSLSNQVKTAEGTRGGSSITTQQKSTPSLSNQVKTAEDLAAQFQVWDKDGNGHVPYNDISFYLGAAVPSNESLRKYDTDGDGEYSLSELNRAFGFDTGSSDDVTQPISLTSTESIP